MGRILILSSDTGEGHNSAARALELAATNLGWSAHVRHPIEESGLGKRFAGFYNTLLTHRPQWMQHYFRLIDTFKPNELIYRFARPYIAGLLDRESPKVLLSVHPMLNYAIQKFVHERKLGIACVSFVTDPFPPFWRGWVSPWVDHFLAATESAREALIRMGAPPERVTTVAMPVRREFSPAPEGGGIALREELEIPGDRTIVINGGARGGGPILDVYRAVRASSDRSAIVVVCGKNESLKREIEAEADRRTRVFGFLSDIHRYIAAADLVLTKPGALATYEALACRVPVLLLGIGGVMPQESGLFGAVARQGAGYAVRTFAELVEVLRQGPDRWQDRVRAIESFYTPESGQTIIERIQPLHVTT